MTANGEIPLHDMIANSEIQSLSDDMTGGTIIFLELP